MSASRPGSAPAQPNAAGSARQPSPHVVVRDDPAHHRFEISSDGVLAGFAEYQLREGEIVFVHTEVLDGFEGKGLAGTLVQHALDSARATGLRIVPVCEYVAGWIKRHPEYLGSVDPAHAARLRG